MEKTSLNDVHHYISSEVYEICHPRNDGFTTWTRKQRLYELKEHLDSALERCPTYAGEEEWLQERKVEKATRILSSDDSIRYY